MKSDRVVESQKRLSKEAKRRILIGTIKKELEGQTLDSFQKMFAIISETRIAIEMGMSFYTLRKKVEDPGEFSLNEVARMASIFNVDFDLMQRFVLSKMKTKPKGLFLNK